jgi:hypothetical protein
MQDQFYGGWNLIGMKNYFADGKVLDTLEPDFQGVRIYTPEGLTSVLIEGAISNEVLGISPATIDESIRRRPFRAYWSRYEVDEEEGVVRHYFIGGSELVSEPLEIREFRFEGENLILTKRDKDFLQDGCYVESIYERWTA